MDLETARALLMLALLMYQGRHQERTFDDRDERNLLSLIDQWWNFYKAWEANDRFVPALEQGRMTMRQGPELLFYGRYLGEKPMPGDFTARHGNVAKQPYQDERYRVGTDSLKERLNPANFGLDQGERLKYKKGLHDLSASLMTPTIPLITDQVRWKWGKLTEWITIFMPMAQPEDTALFALLNSMAKDAKKSRPAISNRVAEIRKRMTRIKLADSVDIGAGLTDVSLPGVDKPKFRYGMKGDLDQRGQLTGVDLERYRKALDYKSILPTDGRATNVNEIVIAYREHEGPRFPVFARFNADRGVFLCDTSEPGSIYIQKGEIPNSWALTGQV